jgi:hypothetical protein
VEVGIVGWVEAEGGKAKRGTIRVVGGKGKKGKGERGGKDFFL